MSINVLGTPFVIVNDPYIADELLSRTGSLYADRPTIQMAELTGWDRALSGARYNTRFREVTNNPFEWASFSYTHSIANS